MSMRSYMPPFLVSLRVTDQGRTKFRLWLPLFLLWLVLLPFLVLVLVLTLLADVLTLPLGNRFNFSRMVIGVLGVMSAARGTEVHIDPRDPKNPNLSVAFTLK